MNILFVNSSPAGMRSLSYQYAEHVIRALKARHPQARVVVRDLAREPLPHIGADFVSARALGPEQRSPAQAAAMALSDVLIDELAAADVVVFAVPMHNFSVPSTLKAWVDHVAVPRRTFRYRDQGPEGLMKGKKAVLVLARGGVYSEGTAKALDFQEPYLRAVLGFIGITHVHVVRVEGVGLGEAALARAKESARVQAQAAAAALA